MNDFLLILQMKQGNEKAFDKFVRKYYAEILSYCRYHCLDQAEAEDLTQETFLRFMENIAFYQHIGKAKNYLYVIAGNLCKNYAKKWKAESLEQEILERVPVSDGGILRKEKRMDVEQALGRLTPEIGKAVEELEISGFSDAELRAYDKFWDSVSVERTLIDDEVCVHSITGYDRTGAGGTFRDTSRVCDPGRGR